MASILIILVLFMAVSLTTSPPVRLNTSSVVLHLPGASKKVLQPNPQHGDNVESLEFPSKYRFYSWNEATPMGDEEVKDDDTDEYKYSNYYDIPYAIRRKRNMYSPVPKYNPSTTAIRAKKSTSFADELIRGSKSSQRNRQSFEFTFDATLDPEEKHYISDLQEAQLLLKKVPQLIENSQNNQPTFVSYLPEYFGDQILPEELARYLVTSRTADDFPNFLYDVPEENAQIWDLRDV